MSLQGPIVVVGEEVDPTLLSAFEEAGGSPALTAAWSKAAGVLSRSEPAAIVFLQPTPGSIRGLDKAAQAIASAPVYTPVLAVADPILHALFPDALPLATDASCACLVGRLAAAQRVRTLHATVLRRAELLGDQQVVADWPATNPLDDATVLVTGRARNYPALSTAVGERLGLIGALGIETAARYLNARDVDGIVIGDGFGPRVVEAFLTALSEDARFRDLPIALVPSVPPGVDPASLPNLESFAGEPAEIVAALLPLVRQHAFEARLKRELASLDAQGLLDPNTGLFSVAAFLRDFARALQEAQARNLPMSIARFSFPAALDQRTSFDAARLVSRLVRNVDFACRASDGSILVVFTGAGLEKSHVVARRIASVLRQTMLAPPDNPAARVDPAVTLAVLKATDTVETLLARVSEPAPVAAA